MSRVYEARFIDIQAPFDNGGVLEADFKLWIYLSGEVYWELRRLIKYRAPDADATTPVHKVLKRNRAVWMTEFQTAGVHEQAIKDSLNAAKVNDDDEAINDPLTREEYSITTGALLCLMLFWCRCTRSLSTRERSRALFQGFLARTVGSYGTVTTIVLEGLQTNAHHCRVDAGHGDLCPHGERTAEELISDRLDWTKKGGVLIDVAVVCGLMPGMPSLLCDTLLSIV